MLKKITHQRFASELAAIDGAVGVSQSSSTANTAGSTVKDPTSTSESIQTDAGSSISKARLPGLPKPSVESPKHSSTSLGGKSPPTLLFEILPTSLLFIPTLLHLLVLLAEVDRTPDLPNLVPTNSKLRLSRRNYKR